MLFDFREHRFRNGNGFDAEGVFDADNTFLSTDDTDEGFDRQLNRFTVVGHGDRYRGPVEVAGGDDVGIGRGIIDLFEEPAGCLLYTSPSPRDRQKSRMPSSA